MTVSGDAALYLLCVAACVALLAMPTMWFAWQTKRWPVRFGFPPRVARTLRCNCAPEHIDAAIAGTLSELGWAYLRESPTGFRADIPWSWFSPGELVEIHVFGGLLAVSSESVGEMWMDPGQNMLNVETFCRRLATNVEAQPTAL